MVPDPGTTEYERWKRCDSMVMSWVLNSMSAEISGTFVYADTSRELWGEICERYHVSHGPLVYQLEQELSQTVQGSLSVTAFYVKLKKIWDELQNLVGLPILYLWNL